VGGRRRRVGCGNPAPLVEPLEGDGTRPTDSRPFPWGMFLGYSIFTDASSFFSRSRSTAQQHAQHAHKVETMHLARMHPAYDSLFSGRKAPRRPASREPPAAHRFIQQSPLPGVWSVWARSFHRHIMGGPPPPTQLDNHGETSRQAEGKARQAPLRRRSYRPRVPAGTKQEHDDDENSQTNVQHASLGNCSRL